MRLLRAVDVERLENTSLAPFAPVAFDAGCCCSGSCCQTCVETAFTCPTFNPCGCHSCFTTGAVA